MTDIERLKKAIRDLYGLEPDHCASMRASMRSLKGRTAWAGIVEIFQVHHPKASHAYAWKYSDDGGKAHYVAVLGVPPVNSAEDAVGVYVVAQEKKKK